MGYSPSTSAIPCFYYITPHPVSPRGNEPPTLIYLLPPHTTHAKYSITPTSHPVPPLKPSQAKTSTLINHPPIPVQSTLHRTLCFISIRWREHTRHAWNIAQAYAKARIADSMSPPVSRGKGEDGRISTGEGTACHTGRNEHRWNPVLFFCFFC
ncbi:hypothetical protein L873DRAFT_777241 [Choiromyces venosus 120613-1]|uniref:Uncharacterized protein n=1 Tax=Choiromyces venosus 120613-1 TaxID=1336337 RepID=A0A3N4JTH6_9PEZI|nr:hypothetical protein L873DRAFT_777241 [Choiromyces venosus 120613-1]